MGASNEDRQEALDESMVSPDLAYELQSKMFDQLATLGMGGAGLVITLAGSVLQGSTMIYIPAVEFGLAALVAMLAQHNLIESLFRRLPSRRKNRLMTALAMLLLGMGVGSLGTTMYKERHLGEAKGGAPAAMKATG